MRAEAAWPRRPHHPCADNIHTDLIRIGLVVWQIRPLGGSILAAPGVLASKWESSVPSAPDVRGRPCHHARFELKRAQVQRP